MEIQTGAALFSLIDQSLRLLKKARDVMPDSEEKKELTKKLAEAEDAYRVAEAKAAQELGYTLCKCSWPPQIMLAVGEDVFECQKCKRRVGNAVSAPEQAPPQALDLEQIKILAYLGNNGSSTLKDIARPLKISEQRTLYWLTKLSEQRLLTSSHVPMVGPMYSLEQLGREYLITKGFL